MKGQIEYILASKFEWHETCNITVVNNILNIKYFLFSSKVNCYRKETCSWWGTVWPTGKPDRHLVCVSVFP